MALGFDGVYYNVNADQMAAACAIACDAQALIFLTDVAGVRGSDGSIIRLLNTASIPALELSSVISGGMLPKLEACTKAVRQGVRRVRIFPACEVEALPDLPHQRSDFGTEVMI